MHTFPLLLQKNFYEATRGIVLVMVKDIILVETPHGEEQFEKDVRILNNIKTNFRINLKCGK
jgi:hypothetical protein